MSDNLSAALKDRVGRAVFDAAHVLLPSRYTHYSGLAMHLRELLGDLGISCVVDVGANVGGYRDFLRRRCGYDGLIISFEPVASLAEALKRRARSDPAWVVYAHALGAEEGRKQINVARNTVFSSFLTPSHAAVDEFEHNVVERVETVEVRRLDAIMNEIASHHGFEDFFLKMDTQGYDLEVLAGASGVLDRVVALQTEVSVRPIYEGMPDYMQSIKALSERGFDLTGLYAVTRDCQHRVVEFDCFAINARRLGLQRTTDGSVGLA
jgi:FkbM family methyltransferase